jgi:hypothetical protein
VGRFADVKVLGVLLARLVQEGGLHDDGSDPVSVVDRQGDTSRPSRCVVAMATILR